MVYVHPPVERIGSRRITSRFGGHYADYRRFSEPGAPSSGHNGLDIAINASDPLLACAAGTMSWVADDPTGYGRYGVLTDDQGTDWLYGHAARWRVSAGQSVQPGQHIADGDSTGNSTGHHLHWGRRPKGYNRGDGYFGYTNPRPFLAPADLPYRVLIQAGHYPNGGGAPGEAEWTYRAALATQAILRSRGVVCDVIGNYLNLTPPPETHRDYDLYLSYHYDAYQPPGYTSGASIARFADELEHWEADRYVNLWMARYPTLTGIPLAMRRVGVDMRYYYGFRPLTAVTPGIIQEHGCGQGDDKAILFDQLDRVAASNAAIIFEYFGIGADVPAPEEGGRPPMPTDEAIAGTKDYFESLGIPVNMGTAILRRAAVAHLWGEGRGPAITGEYTIINRFGVKVARQRFSGGVIDYHTEGEHQGQTFWGEVVAHPEDAA